MSRSLFVSVKLVFRYRAAIDFYVGYEIHMVHMHRFESNNFSRSCICYAKLSTF